jgi:hypothetical protein
VRECDVRVCMHQLERRPEQRAAFKCKMARVPSAMVPLPPAERSCLKRSSTYACSPVGKARRVTINADANKTRLVPYYGRPAQSPELARKCFYTQDDCARPAASRITCVLPAF